MPKRTLTTAELKTWLITQHLTAGALAKLINLPAWTVRRWELGKRPIPPWLRQNLELIEKQRVIGPACKRCCKKLPDNTRVDTKYCSGKCRTRDYLERRSAKSTLPTPES